ncbi:methionine gamma-lyase [Halobacillus salinarum]|uniref:L-methionine gamma-lyase n=1 Tax=Halobacillus salinarum TaxID=2932257 RepID=A0ABY4EL93_9BACI|nr:methionine gamma-lyase [Halobacillus salinarum]UOQ45233.1 methionine gamma-lyase [Halobacillus salinarum]
MVQKKSHIETSLIHTDSQPINDFGSLTTPIFQTSTFAFSTAAQGAARFKGEEEGYIYSRLANPTVRVLEDRIAALEGGEKGLAFASGMAAISSVLLALTSSGDHIVCTNGLYGCTYGLLTLLQDKYKVGHSFCAMTSEEELRKQIQPNTTCIFIETPINPTMRAIDLHMAARIAKNYDIPVVVDNTFSTPYLQRPLDCGCEVVVHSATKYIGGHGDVVAGLVVGKSEFIGMLAKTTQKDIGGILSPFDAWLLIRGLKTMHIRMDRHCFNALKVSERLQDHPRVQQVYFPGSARYPDYDIVKQQMSQGGGILSFEVKGNREDAERVLDQLKLIKIAVSLGDAETLIQLPATMTHSTIPPLERERMGISDTLLRLSVGLEHWEDIWKDLNQALLA